MGEEFIFTEEQREELIKRFNDCDDKRVYENSDFPIPFHIYYEFGEQNGYTFVSYELNTISSLKEKINRLKQGF